jgi:hypothetical protein
MRVVVIMLTIAVVALAAAYLVSPRNSASTAQIATPTATAAPVTVPPVAAPPVAAPAVAVVKPVVVHYRAVLVAGDASIPNFDNATLILANRLRHSGDEATVLTSDGRIVNSWRSYATIRAIDDGLAGVKPGEGCLVFVTSHGNEYGLVLGADYSARRYLTPTRLSQILAAHCRDRPTVVILSGCHTGTFMRPEMKAPNRIVLTASSKDRTSFGCSADSKLTYFDECLIEALGDGGTWAAIFERTRVCVRFREVLHLFRPSQPQAYFGSEVQNLGIE